MKAYTSIQKLQSSETVSQGRKAGKDENKH